MVKTCPHCGSITETVLFRSPIHRRIYNYLLTHQGASRSDVIAAVWAEDPNGGPEAVSTVSVHINRMNKQLREKGLQIQGNLGREGGYRILPLKAS